MTESRPVVVYSTGWCPYCSAARALLERKQVTYEEIDLMEQPERREEMEKRSGRRTVPQIFIGDVHVGGYDDLHALERDGKLDELLGSS